MKKLFIYYVAIALSILGISMLYWMIGASLIIVSILIILLLAVVAGAYIAFLYARTIEDIVISKNPLSTTDGKFLTFTALGSLLFFLITLWIGGFMIVFAGIIVLFIGIASHLELTEDLQH